MKIASQALYLGAAWVLGYAVTKLAGGGLSAVNAYAVITGWWLAAFAAAKMRPDLRSALLLMAIYFVAFLAISLSGGTWLYADAESATLLRISTIGILQSLAIGTPIFFNALVDWSVKLMTRNRSMEP